MKLNMPVGIKNAIRENMVVIRAINAVNQKEIIELLETSNLTLSAIEKGEKDYSDNQYFILTYFIFQALSNKKVYAYLQAVNSELIDFVQNLYNHSSINLLASENDLHEEKKSDHSVRKLVKKVSSEEKGFEQQESEQKEYSFVE